MAATSFSSTVESVAFEGNMTHVFLKGATKKDITVTVGRHGGAKIPGQGEKAAVHYDEAYGLVLPEGKMPVTSRTFVLLIPFIVIAAFWLLSRYESKLGHDPTHKSYWERNGMVLGLTFIGLVAFWTLFLVTLPYLYMVVESFHPKLPPAQRGGPNDFLTLAQYKSFFVSPTDNEWNTLHMSNFVYSIVVSAIIAFFNLCICYPLAYYMAQSARRRRCACSCWR